MSSKAKQITEEQARKALTECGANMSDRTDSAVRAGAVQRAVGHGDSPREIALAGRMPESVGSCVAERFGLVEPSRLEKLKGWLTSVHNDAVRTLEVLPDLTRGVIRDAAPVGANIATAGGVDTIRTYQAGTAERASQISAPTATR